MEAFGSGSLQKPVNILLGAEILCIAINLRTALAGVGPLIANIKEGTGLSNSLFGLLPLLAFGVESIVTPLFTKKFGIGIILLGAMLFLGIGIGIGIRAIDFYCGTLLLGIAIAFGNVLLPSLTKHNFAKNSEFITSLYASIMALGASLAAGLSVPLAEEAGLGWRGSLGVWDLLAIVAAIVWLPELSRLRKSAPSRSFTHAIRNVTRLKLAWRVALFIGYSP
jgi:CP family cyanate transporter-like MFS transporter